jgi:hypothetical protein
MGFVNLPVEGDPVARLPEVLDQIQSALAEDHSMVVRRLGNRIEFSSNSFSGRWLSGGRFRAASSGEIEAGASSDSLMIDYRLSFFESLVVWIVMAMFYVVVIALHNGIASLGSHLTVLLFGLVICFGSSIVLAGMKFSRFLRQFPREAGSAR